MRRIALAWLLSAPLARAANRTVGPAATEIHYHGAWSSASASSGATYQLSRDADATATFAFTGSAVYVLSTGSGRGGPAVIEVDAGIDNGYQYTIVGSAGEGSVLYARTGLVANSAHVVNIAALGGDSGVGPGAPIEVYGFIFDDGASEPEPAAADAGATSTDTAASSGPVPSNTRVSTVYASIASTVYASVASGVFSAPYSYGSVPYSYTSGTGSAYPVGTQASSFPFPLSTQASSLSFSFSTQTSTPSYPTSPSSSPITMRGVIVGALGGAVLGALATLLVLRCLRQRRRQRARGRFVPMAHDDESRVSMSNRAHLRAPSSRSSWTAAAADPFAADPFADSYTDHGTGPFSAEPSSVSDTGSSLTAHSRAVSQASRDTVRTAVFAPSKARGSGSSGLSGAPPEYSSSRGSGSRYIEKYEVER